MLERKDSPIINAKSIEIGRGVKIGKNVVINVHGKFHIGDYSVLGNNTKINGNNVMIGRHFYNSSDLKIGGGGNHHPNANLTIGDRCVVHNNFINICEDVYIGDDVGLSPDVSILSHGFWLSVLDGYPAKFSGVKIGNGVIIGYRSLIMMGVEIADNSVIGASSVVTKSIKETGVYAGNPARFIRKIVPLNRQEKGKTLLEIIDSYRKIAEYHGISPLIRVEYPNIFINDFMINVETFEYEGDEDYITDDARDYLRKWGIRIYTGRPFVSNVRGIDNA